MSNYALHFSPGVNTEHELYVWFQRDGIHYIEGSDEVGWTEPRRLGHTTRDMNDYEHMFWALKPEYSETVERASMFEVQPRKEGEHGRLTTGPQVLPEARNADPP